jgi:hypothetical protein
MTEKEITIAICNEIRAKFPFWCEKSNLEIKRYHLYFDDIFELICNEGLTIEEIEEYIKNR